MNHLRPWLLIGGYRDTLDEAVLLQSGVRALLQLAAPVHHPQVQCQYLAVEDGEPIAPTTFDRGLAFSCACYQQHTPLLIACGAGVSRSATFAIATLKTIESLSLWDAFWAVKTAHPAALPHPVLWESLGHYFHEPIPFLDLWRAVHATPAGATLTTSSRQHDRLS